MATAAGVHFEQFGMPVVYRQSDRDDQTVTAVVSPETPAYQNEDGRQMHHRSREIKIRKADITPQLTDSVVLAGETWRVSRFREHAACWLITVARPEVRQAGRPGFRDRR